MHHGRHRDAFERAVDRLDGEALGGVRIVAQPRLVELDDVGAGACRSRASALTAAAKSIASSSWSW
jgi:hypothetical protein